MKERLFGAVCFLAACLTANSSSAAPDAAFIPAAPVDGANIGVMRAIDFPAGGGYYVDRDKWLAIDPGANNKAATQAAFSYRSGTFNVTLYCVGENDGKSKYDVSVGGQSIGKFECPLAAGMYDEGAKYAKTWQNVKIEKGATIEVASEIGSNDGQEFSRARWSRLTFAAADGKSLGPAAPMKSAQAPAAPLKPLVLPRQPDGDGSITVSGELKQWHKVTLTYDGPYAHELDNEPNPFTDYNFQVVFTHESGAPKYIVPAYFAADGKAGETSAESGTKWRAHLSPDKPGGWTYRLIGIQAPHAALNVPPPLDPPIAVYEKSGSFTVRPTDKSGRDFRGKGRLQYVGKHHLRFAGSGEYFLKAGADAPETFLAYKDFDGTYTNKVPLKSWQPHVRDWRPGDPTWQGGKGKGMIGALNYLAGKGCTGFSFLTYNAGGDGDNLWPFVKRDDKLHYDCSKLDQWGVVFDHAQSIGLYLHFKMQETEIDGGGKDRGKPWTLDGGDLGVERRLYCRELIARFGHELALNWNLGEENDQTPEQQRAMAKYIADTDPYDHNLVIHTFPPQQDKVYSALIGKQSVLTGASLQNHWDQAHQRTLKWINESAKAGRPWVCANDEQGSAASGVPPDPGFQGFDGKDAKGKKIQTIDDIRKATLWGNLMAGGAGVEYYFGYQLPENDLLCENYRSRDKSWDYCRIALEFFQDNAIPFWEMKNADALIGNPKNNNSKYCLAKPGELYLVYLPTGGSTDLDLTAAKGSFTITWFNPRTGGPLHDAAKTTAAGGEKISFSPPPHTSTEDWLAVIRK